VISTTALTGIFGTLYLAGAAATAVTGALAWHRRRAATAAVALAVYMACLTADCLTEFVVLLANSGSLPQSLVLPAFRPIVPLAAMMPCALWVMSQAVARPDWRPSRRTVVALGTFPMFCVVAVAVNGSDGPLFRLTPHPGAAWPQWVGRPLYLPWGAALLGLTIWTFATLVRARRHSSPLLRRQAGALLVAMLAPTPGAVIQALLPQGSVPDLAPMSYVATGLISGYALLRFGLLQIVPVARGLVFDRLRDAVIVLDTDRRLIDVNRAGERLLRAARPELPTSLTGHLFDDLLPARKPVRIQAIGDGSDGEYEVDLPDGRMVLDIRLEPLTDGRGRPIGRVIVLRDITELYRLREHLAEQAVRDELTGLYNRRHLLDVLARELADPGITAGTGTGRPDLCVVMMDLDHFKSVNDEHGHLVGDALLAATSRALVEGVREGDVVARYGGEEFAVLLPGVTLEQGLRRTEELRQRCEEVRVETGSGTVGRTVSAGVVSIRGAVGEGGSGPVTPASLLTAADRALYRAKAAGRNRVVAVA